MTKKKTLRGCPRTSGFVPWQVVTPSFLLGRWGTYIYIRSFAAEPALEMVALKPPFVGSARRDLGPAVSNRKQKQHDKQPLQHGGPLREKKLEKKKFKLEKKKLYYKKVTSRILRFGGVN